MIRTLIIMAAAASVLGCETTQPVSSVDYQLAIKPPVLNADAPPARCGNPFGYQLGAPVAGYPNPIERCIPRWPDAGMAAGITGACLTVFTLQPNGRPNVQTTTCNVGDARTPAWRAYAENAYAQSASDAIARYAFHPEDAATWSETRFAVRTLFLFVDEPNNTPLSPTLPVDVVEIPVASPTS